MKIHIYYGGRGMIDDPTLFVINKMQEVLEELNVSVTRYNLFEEKNNIPTLPQTLKEADGIILASTVEWYGIGGYMSQFLDACWLYGDKEKIAGLYMCPVVMSTTYGEREGKLNLQVAWEILGGLPCSGLCGYISDPASLELNETYIKLIEKKAENMYRTISQKVASFPASNQAVKQKISLPSNSNFTPQETEQLSQYVADDNYMQTQKDDIKELTNLFKGKLEKAESEDTTAYVGEFERAFTPVAGFKAVAKMNVEGRKSPLILQVSPTECKAYYGTVGKCDVEMEISQAVLNEIVNGRMTFQRAFMGGSMKSKGDFLVMRTLDQVFPFLERAK